VVIHGRVTSHAGELLPAPVQDGHISSYISYSHSTSYLKHDRAGGIRTHDLLNPIQAHYQAVLRPDGKEAPRCGAQDGFSSRKSILLQSTSRGDGTRRAGSAIQCGLTFYLGCPMPATRRRCFLANGSSVMELVFSWRPGLLSWKVGAHRP
jgi:hypothetical protein